MKNSVVANGLGTVTAAPGPACARPRTRARPPGARELKGCVENTKIDLLEAKRIWQA